MRTECYVMPNEVVVNKFEDNYNVRIYSNVVEDKDEEGNTKYICDMYEFNCKCDTIDIDDVIANPLRYIGYDPIVTVGERLSAIEDALLEIIGGM